MVKKSRKIILSTLCAALIVSMIPATAAFARQPKVSKSDKIEAGISKLMETGLTREEILKIYPEKDLIEFSKSKEIKIDTTFIEVSEQFGQESHEQISEEKCMEKVYPKSTSISLMSMGNPTTVTPNGYIRQSVTMSKMYDGRYLLSYYGQWLTIPPHRNYDTCALTATNLNYSSLVSCFYAADQETVKTFCNKTSRQNTTYRRDLYPTINSIGAGMSTYLCCDTGNSYGGYFKTIITNTFTNHRMYISFYASKATSSHVLATVRGQYFHQTSGHAPSSFSFYRYSDVSGISLYNLSNQLYMTPDPYIKDYIN